MLIIIFVLLVFGVTALTATDIYVFDSVSKTPLENVVITSNIDALHYKIYTDKSGKATISSKQTQQIILQCSKFGYYTYIDSIQINTNTSIMLIPRLFVSDEVVVTGQYTPCEAKQSVYPVSIIGVEQIRSRATTSLRDLLLTEPGMKIAQDNILGSEITINGISGANVKILLDGVPVIGRMDGIIDINQLNLNNIKKLEIIDGPVSAIYGSDALGGIINISTQDPYNTYAPPSVKAAFAFESIGKYDLDLSSKFSLGKVNFIIAGGRNVFQGYDRDSRDRNIEWNPKEQYFANLSSSYSPASNINLKYSGQFFNEYILNRGSKRQPYFESAFDDKYYTRRYSNSLSANIQTGKAKLCDITMSASYYNRRKNTYLTDLTTLNETLSGNSSDADTNTFTSYFIRSTFTDGALTNNLKYQIGGEINYETAEGNKIRSGKRSMGDYAIFAGCQYMPTTFLNIAPSVRFIKNTRYSAPIIPAVNMRIQASENLFFRLNAATGFRAPSIKELFMEFVNINHNIHGNENLDAEQSYNVNVNAEWNICKSNAMIKVIPKIFYNHIDNLITIAEISSASYSYVNIGTYETTGGNCAFNLFTTNASLKFTLGILGIRSKISENIEYKNDDFQFSPDMTLALDYIIPHTDINFNATYKYTGKVTAFSTESEENGKVEKYTVDDYQMLNIMLSKKIFSRITLQIGAKNLFNVKNINKSNYVESMSESGNTLPISWGRTLFCKIAIEI